MRIIIRNGVAFFTDLGYLPIQEIPVTVDMGTLDWNTVEIVAKINSLPSRIVKQGTFTIPEKELQKEQLSVDLTIKDIQSKATVTYKMDPVNVRKAVLLGPDVYEQYPATMKSLNTQIAELRQLYLEVGQALVELGKKGEIL